VAALLQPARAKLQKFAALLETNASFSLLPDGAGLAEEDEVEGVELLLLLQPETTTAAHNTRSSGWIFFIFIRIFWVHFWP
jgi:hypothetical protein